MFKVNYRSGASGYFADRPEIAAKYEEISDRERIEREQMRDAILRSAQQTVQDLGDVRYDPVRGRRLGPSETMATQTDAASASGRSSASRTSIKSKASEVISVASSHRSSTSRTSIKSKARPSTPADALSVASGEPSQAAHVDDDRKSAASAHSSRSKKSSRSSTSSSTSTSGHSGRAPHWTNWPHTKHDATTFSFRIPDDHPFIKGPKVLFVGDNPELYYRSPTHYITLQAYNEAYERYKRRNKPMPAIPEAQSETKSVHSAKKSETKSDTISLHESDRITAVIPSRRTVIDPSRRDELERLAVAKPRPKTPEDEYRDMPPLIKPSMLVSNGGLTVTGRGDNIEFVHRGTDGSSLKIRISNDPVYDGSDDE